MKVQAELQAAVERAFRARRPPASLPWIAAERISGADRHTPPAANCLRPLMAALGWTGEARYLQEAIGDDRELATLADLRHVLYRLNYVTAEVAVRPGEMPGSGFPFLLALGSGDIWVVLSRSEDGRLTVFKGESGMTGIITADAAAALEARVYTVSADAARSKSAGRAFSSWTTTMMASEARTVRSLFLITFAVNIVALAVPIYLIAIYDRAIAAKSVASLAYLLAGVLLALGVEILLREMRARSLAYLGARIEGLMMTAAFERLLLLPANMIENASVGAQIARLKLFESMRDVFSGPLAAALLDLPFVAIFVFAVFFIGGVLGWLIVAFIALLVLLIGLAVPMARRHSSQAGDMRSESHKFLMELADNIEVIRRCGAEEVWIGRYRVLTESNLLHAASAHKASVLEQTLSQSLVLLTGGAIIGFGAYLVIEGQFTAGALFAMMALVWRVLGPIQTAFLNLNKLSQAAGIIRQMDQLMRIEPEYRPEVVPTVARTFSGPIELQGVVMRYAPRGEPAIRGISLQVPRNGFVALTGHVGAGKSTLLKIIAQLYLPQAGAVLIDGLDYRQFDARLLRHGIGFLPQTQDLFGGTIAENIRLNYPAASDEAILSLLKDFGGEDVLAGIEGGIDAPLDRHHPIIGSEAFLQNVMLARAFIASPNILLLDEPASRLNASEDDALRSKLRAMKGRATIVLATTRPSYMYLADRLVVLRSGQIIAQDAPNRVIAALLGEKFKAAAASGQAVSPPKDISDILANAPKEAQR
jgi:ATP-binding cassette, subfamily C, bacterial LapB